MKYKYKVPLTSIAMIDYSIINRYLEKESSFSLIDIAKTVKSEDAFLEVDINEEKGN